ATALVPAVRAAVREADPSVSLVSVGPLATNSLLAAGFAPYRVSAAAFTLFGVLALALAAVGLYAVVAYAVAQRAGEFGIRMAIGARGRDVVALVLGQGLRTVAAGGAAGALGAVAVGRLLRARLYGVGPLDPVSLAVTAAVLIGAALLAAWLPARRAARVDPMQALRAE
ncbi:MAG TPA: FtsX-like permease family protein, partial [Gemmatirosa sp.]